MLQDELGAGDEEIQELARVRFSTNHPCRRFACRRESRTYPKLRRMDSRFIVPCPILAEASRGRLRPHLELGGAGIRDRAAPVGGNYYSRIAPWRGCTSGIPYSSVATNTPVKPVQFKLPERIPRGPGGRG